MKLLTKSGLAGTRMGAHLGRNTHDLLPDLPSFIRRVCSSFAPPWGVLRTRLV
jgi:hypothetical protein